MSHFYQCILPSFSLNKNWLISKGDYHQIYTITWLPQNMGFWNSQLFPGKLLYFPDNGITDSQNSPEKWSLTNPLGELSRKKDSFSWKTIISLSFNFINQYFTNPKGVMFLKCTKRKKLNFREQWVYEKKRMYGFTHKPTWALISATKTSIIMAWRLNQYMNQTEKHQTANFIKPSENKQ